MNLLLGVRSDKGHRADNEDSLAMNEQLGLYVVADGTGGRAGGNTASRMACETIHEVVAAEQASLPDLDEKAIRVLLQRAVEAANERILAGQADPTLHGMATTVAIVLHQDDRAFLAHVGDSRVYLLHNRALQQLTRDHSLENFLADNPQIQPKVQRPGRTLVRALGLQAKSPEADQQTIQLYPNDVLMMCSDGVTDVLVDSVLTEILVGVEATTSAEVAQCLVRAALTHGTVDNITAAVLHVCVDPESTLVFETSDQQVLGWLTFLEGPRQGTVLPLARSTKVGADPSSALHLDDGFVSAAHAEIFCTEVGFTVRDLGSTNGTFVNEVRITHQPLADADVLRIGRTSMVFKDYRYTPA